MWCSTLPFPPTNQNTHVGTYLGTNQVPHLMTHDMSNCERSNSRATSASRASASRVSVPSVRRNIVCMYRSVHTSLNHAWAYLRRLEGLPRWFSTMRNQAERNPPAKASEFAPL